MGYIFVHGLGQTSSSWERTVSSLPAHRLVNCPDLAGLLTDKEGTYKNLYKGFVEYCEGLEGPLNVCGLSLGGILALNYALDYPEKVESLVLIATQYEMPKTLLKLQNIIFRLMPSRAFRDMGFQKQDFFLLIKSMMDLNFSAYLSDISCPALIVCGEKDHANKKASKALGERIPQAALQYIPNAGHEVNTQAPLQLAEALETFYESLKKDRALD